LCAAEISQLIPLGLELQTPANNIILIIISSARHIPINEYDDFNNINNSKPTWQTPSPVCMSPCVYLDVVYYNIDQQTCDTLTSYVPTLSNVAPVLVTHSPEIIINNIHDFINNHKTLVICKQKVSPGPEITLSTATELYDGLKQRDMHV
jgi:hypothetical protein